ncbi:unnamed protein product [Prunus brigantina]
MESGTVHNSESSVKKGTRRKWLPFEEDALLTILEDFVTRGHRCDMGSFKSDTLDCATGKGSEVPVEMMEEQSHNEVNPSDIAGENEFPMSQESGKRMQMVTEATVKGNEDCSDIAKMLKDMNLSPMDQIDALTLILEKPQIVVVF